MSRVAANFRRKHVTDKSENSIQMPSFACQVLCEKGDCVGAVKTYKQSYDLSVRSGGVGLGQTFLLLRTAPS